MICSMVNYFRINKLNPKIYYWQIIVNYGTLATVELRSLTQKKLKNIKKTYYLRNHLTSKTQAVSLYHSSVMESN